jgi:predicted HAD superfamily Cof-like phosphohydrolase
MTNYEMVLEFNKKFDIRIGAKGFLLPLDRAMLRTRLMVEEMAESIEAMQLNDYEQIAKELADSLYTVYATAAEYGIPMDDVFAEVHRSNMTKTENLDPGGKILKGNDYEKADIASALWRK